MENKSVACGPDLIETGFFVPTTYVLVEKYEK